MSESSLTCAVSQSHGNILSGDAEAPSETSVFEHPSTVESPQQRNLAVLHDLIFASPEIPQLMEDVQSSDAEDANEDVVAHDPDNELQLEMARWNFPGTLVDNSPSQPRSSLVAKRNTRPASWVSPETSTVSPKTSVDQASFLAERSLRRSRSFQQAHSGVSTPGG